MAKIYDEFYKEQKAKNPGLPVMSENTWKAHQLAAATTGKVTDNNAPLPAPKPAPPPPVAPPAPAPPPPVVSAPSTSSSSGSSKKKPAPPAPAPQSSALERSKTSDTPIYAGDVAYYKGKEYRGDAMRDLRLAEESKGKPGTVTSLGDKVYADGKAYTKDEWAAERKRKSAAAAQVLKSGGLQQADAERYASAFAAELNKGRGPGEVLGNIGSTVGGRNYGDVLTKLEDQGMNRDDAAAAVREQLGGQAGQVGLGPNLQLAAALQALGQTDLLPKPVAATEPQVQTGVATTQAPAAPKAPAAATVNPYDGQTILGESAWDYVQQRIRNGNLPEKEKARLLADPQAAYNHFQGIKTTVDKNLAESGGIPTAPLPAAEQLANAKGGPNEKFYQDWADIDAAVKSKDLAKAIELIGQQANFENQDQILKNVLAASAPAATQSQPGPVVPAGNGSGAGAVTPGGVGAVTPGGVGAEVPAAPTTGAPSPAPQATSTPAPTAGAGPAAPGADTSTFDFDRQPSTMTELMADPERYQQYLNTAQQILAAKFDPQKLALQQGLERQTAGFDQERQALIDQQTQEMERNRRLYGSLGLAESGFLAGANTGVQQETARSLAAATAQRRMLETQGSEQLTALEAQRAAELTPTVQSLLTDDRNFGLQDRQQQFIEFSATKAFNEDVRQFGMEYALKQAEEARVNQMHLYNVQAAKIANDIARQTAPFAIDSARLANIHQQLANQGVQLTNAEANEKLYRDMEWFKMNPFADKRMDQEYRQLQMDAAKLEHDLATNPEYGKSAEAKARLGQIEAQTAAFWNQATSESGGDAGFTAWQVYQMNRDILEDDRYTDSQKSDANRKADQARTAVVEDVTRNYKVGRTAADLWVSVMDIINLKDENGRPTRRYEAEETVKALLQGKAIDGAERAWLDAKFRAAYGDAGAQVTIDTFRRDIRSDDGGDDGDDIVPKKLGE